MGGKIRRFLIIAVVVVCLWYGCMLLPPGYTNGGRPALMAVVRATMRHVATEYQTYDEAFAYFERFGWETRKIHGAQYVYTLMKEEGDSWSLIARPRKAVVYDHILPLRILLLDFEKHHYRTYRIHSGDKEAEVVR